MLLLLLLGTLLFMDSGGIEGIGDGGKENGKDESDEHGPYTFPGGHGVV